MPKKGYKQTQQHIRKKVIKIRGENNPNWKGGIKSLNRREWYINYFREYRKREDKIKAQVRNHHKKLKLRFKEIEGEFTYKEWKEKRKEFNYSCAVCGKKEPFSHCKFKKLTIDHIISIRNGGKNIISNIQPLCIVCNAKKANK